MLKSTEEGAKKAVFAGPFRFATVDTSSSGVFLCIERDQNTLKFTSYTIEVFWWS